MISKMTLYRARCDRCTLIHPMALPKSLLKTALKKDGWRIATEDHVLCPHCAAMEEKE